MFASKGRSKLFALRYVLFDSNYDLYDDKEKMYIQMDRSERTVRVLGMSYLMDCDFIYDLFNEMGPVEKVIFREHPNGTPRDALVVFKSKASVEEAVRNLHRREVYGALLIVRPLRSNGRHVCRDVDVSAGRNEADPYPTERRFFPSGSNAQYFPQGGEVSNTGLGMSRSAEAICMGNNNMIH